jgi:hypothetical protein
MLKACATLYHNMSDTVETFSANVYKIFSPSNPDAAVYIGVDKVPLENIMRTFKTCYAGRNKPGARQMWVFDVMKFEDAKIELLEETVCKSYQEMILLKAPYIRSMKTVNRSVPGRTEKEYRQVNREKINARKRELRAEKKLLAEPIVSEVAELISPHERYLEYQKAYRESHKDEIHAKRTEVITCECGRQCSRHHLQDHRRTDLHQRLMQELAGTAEPVLEPVAKSPVDRSEKTTCECGCVITRYNLASHRKTKKHAELMKAKSDSPELILMQ